MFADAENMERRSYLMKFCNCGSRLKKFDRLCGRCRKNRRQDRKEQRKLVKELTEIQRNRKKSIVDLLFRG